MTGDYIMGVRAFYDILANCEDAMTNDWREISAAWKGDLIFSGENTRGGSVQMGEVGKTSDLSPMELVLVGLAGCTGIDVVSILQKKKTALADFKVNIRGKRASSPPMVYTDIEVEYLFWGENLKIKDVEQAITLSEEKYCSVSIMLGKTAKITSSYKILKPGETEL
jgi:putative redox protein